MSEASNKSKGASSTPASTQKAPSRTPRAPNARPGQGQPRPPRPPRAALPDGEGALPPPRREGRPPRLTPEEQAPRDAEPAFRTPLPPIPSPEALPVSGRRHEIAEALQGHQVIIVSGETGSGKTTQLPKICLELGRGR